MLRWILAAVTALCATPAAAAWTEARTGHFIVYSDDAPVRVRDLAARLERFDKAIRQLHGLPDQPGDRANPLTVYVVQDAAAVQRLCSGGQGRPAGCANVYGFYNGRAEGSVAFMPRHAGNGDRLDLNPQIVLFHEYSHHIMMANYAAAYPAWFVEGFAEFNSTADFARDGTVGFGRPAMHRFYGLVSGKPLKLAAMLAADGRKLDAAQREAVYGRGWLLTHYLTFEPARKGQLDAYLAAVNRGTPSLKAAEAAFGDLTRLDRELDGYMRRPKMSYYAVKVAELPDDAVIVRTLTAGEAATMAVRLRSDRGVDATTAAPVAVEARRAAAPFPTDAGAQGVLAEAEYDAGDDAAADAAAGRALAADPKDRQAMIYKGRVAVRRAAAAGMHDAATWKAARGWFVRANRAEPDAATPLYLFYRSFLEEGVRPTANAAAGLVRAFELAPQDDDLRFLLARDYLGDGKLAEARTVLAPLAFSPHAAADNPAARLIGLIDHGDRAAIATALAGREK